VSGPLRDRPGGVRLPRRLLGGHEPGTTEERWLKARGCRSWLNHYTYVTDLWDNFWHDHDLALPVMAVALRFGYWPEDDGPPAEPGPAAAGGSAAEDPAAPGYGSILADEGEPLFGGGGPPGQD
jgi:hypothetical protein